jgi:hypothetical protein
VIVYSLWLCACTCISVTQKNHTAFDLLHCVVDAWEQKEKHFFCVVYSDGLTGGPRLKIHLGPFVSFELNSILIITI